jgi:hypothetical protein
MVIQATGAVVRESEHSDEYQQGFSQGFKTALQHVINSVRARAESIQVWNLDHIKNVLLGTQGVMQTVASAHRQSWSADYDLGFQRGLEAALWCVAASFGADLTMAANGAQPAKEMSPSFHPIWFREDVDNVLSALQAVMVATASEETALPKDYNRGFGDALQCVAESLGVRLLGPQDRPTLIQAAFWLRQDLENNLQAIYQTKQATIKALEHSTWSADYNWGFDAALHCLAQALGVNLLLS